MRRLPQNLKRKPWQKCKENRSRAKADAAKADAAVVPEKADAKAGARAAAIVDPRASAGKALAATGAIAVTAAIAADSRDHLKSISISS